MDDKMPKCHVCGTELELHGIDGLPVRFQCPGCGDKISVWV